MLVARSALIAREQCRLTGDAHHERRFRVHSRVRRLISIADCLGCGAGARILGNTAVASTTVFDSALLSTWIPGQFLGIFRTEEEPTNSLHAFHVAGSLTWRTRRAGRDGCRAGNRDANRCSTCDVRRLAHAFLRRCGRTDDTLGEGGQTARTLKPSRRTVYSGHGMCSGVHPIANPAEFLR